MRRSLRKTNRILLALLLLGVFAVYCGNVCFAAPSGSLTLVCVWHGENGDVYLSGDEYSLVLIADAELDAQGTVIALKTRQSYADYDCNWFVQSASELAQKAQELQKAAERTGAVNAVGKTDAKGSFCFSGLTPGLYLVFRSRVADANKGYTPLPSLLLLPQSYPEGVSFDLTVTPKLSGPPETDGGKTTDPPPPAVPKTGQLNWPIPLLSLLGVGLVTLGLLMNRKDRKKDRPN